MGFQIKKNGPKWNLRELRKATTSGVLNNSYFKY